MLDAKRTKRTKRTERVYRAYQKSNSDLYFVTNFADGGDDIKRYLFASFYPKYGISPSIVSEGVIEYASRASREFLCAKSDFKFTFFGFKFSNDTLRNSS